MDDDLVPARMVNEWAYCPRLAWLEWIDGEWADSADTVHGRQVHARVDAGDETLPGPDEMPTEDKVVARAVMLSAPAERLIARMDLIESDGERLRPVDYKRSRAPDHPAGAWLPERVQVAAQALVLRANGYACDEGVIYFAGSRRRVRVPIDEELLAATRAAVSELLAARERGERPPPLIDSPKCFGCSLAPICLPDEINVLEGRKPEAGEPADETVRRLFPARDDALPLHVATQGARVTRKGEELVVTFRRKGEPKDEEMGRARLPGTSSVAIYGNVTVTTPALQSLLGRGIPVSFFSVGGWYHGQAQGFPRHALAIRRAQYAAADDPERCLEIARRLVRTKIHNQRALLRRNHDAAPGDALQAMKTALHRVDRASNLDQVLGCEGEAAATYFAHFGSLLRPPGDGDGEVRQLFAWEKRTRRPPTDPVNAALSFAYALLTREWTTVLLQVGLDPMLGFLHQPRPGRPSLALDLMEEFRPIIADSTVLTAFNNGELTPAHFVRSGPACNLNEAGRKVFLRTWERRLDTLSTHPVFGYRLSCRRTFDVQARLFARHLVGEIPDYPELKVR